MSFPHSLLPGTYRLFHGRVSAGSEDDIGLDAFNGLTLAGYKVRIMLDGLECADVCTAEPNEGWVRRVKLDARGMAYAVGDEIAIEVVHGLVEVRISKA